MRRNTHSANDVASKAVVIIHRSSSAAFDQKRMDWLISMPTSTAWNNAPARSGPAKLYGWEATLTGRNASILKSFGWKEGTQDEVRMDCGAQSQSQKLVWFIYLHPTVTPQLSRPSQVNKELYWPTVLNGCIHCMKVTVQATRATGEEQKIADALLTLGCDYESNRAHECATVSLSS